MTRAELLTGVKQPLSNSEYVDWVALTRIEAAEAKQQQARAKAKKR